MEVILIEGIDLYIVLDLFLAYLIGNLSLSYAWVKIKLKKDLRKIGSGSLGATNASRVLGKPGFIATFLFDVLKGALAILLLGLFTDNSFIISLAAVFVVAGHVWPVIFGFHGGKGLSTVLGAFLAIDPYIIFLFFAVATLIYLIKRNKIFAGVIGFLVLPPLLIAFGYSYEFYIPLILAELIIIWAHRTNIKEQFA